jgi:hypothetical protein
MRQVIEEFLSDRRDLRIKAKTKDFIKKENRNPDEIEIQEIINNAQNEFSFENWIVSKSKILIKLKFLHTLKNSAIPTLKPQTFIFLALKKMMDF